MNVIYTVLFAFALGFFIKNTGIATAVYLAGDALVFGYQSVNLLLEWGGGHKAAFGGPFPDHDTSGVVGYGLVNLVITVVGVGLVVLGARVAARRVAKKDVVSVG